MSVHEGEHNLCVGFALRCGDPKPSPSVGIDTLHARRADIHTIDRTRGASLAIHLRPAADDGADEEKTSIQFREHFLNLNATSTQSVQNGGKSRAGKYSERFSALSNSETETGV
eukprot:scaffold14642_cov64-Phaeocystis_antarctica.AAC.2